MKAVARLLPVLLAFYESQCAAQPSTVPRLAGIVSLPDLKLALFAGAAQLRQPSWLQVREGQENEGVEVLKIHPESNEVELKLKGMDTPLTLTLTRQTNSQAPTGPGINLEDVGLRVVLDIYGELCGRSLLRSPLLPATNFSVGIPATNRADAAKALERIFAEKEITTIPDGSKFVMVVPTSQASEVNPHAPQVPSSSPASVTKSATPEIISPGSLVDFRGADIRQVLDVYAVLIGAQLDPTGLPYGRAISFFTQTPLTKEETIYAFDTLFSWAGFKVVPAANGFVKAVPLSEK